MPGKIAVYCYLLPDQYKRRWYSVCIWHCHCMWHQHKCAVKALQSLQMYMYSPTACFLISISEARQFENKRHMFWSDFPGQCPSLRSCCGCVGVGTIMGAAAQFNVTVRGRGGHAAMPHTTVDPLVAGAAIVTALQVCLASCLHSSDAAFHFYLVQHRCFSCYALTVFRILPLPLGVSAHCKLLHCLWCSGLSIALVTAFCSCHPCLSSLSLLCRFASLLFHCLQVLAFSLPVPLRTPPFPCLLQPFEIPLLPTMHLMLLHQLGLDSQANTNSCLA